MGLIIGIFLAGCAGGLALPDQSNNAAAASEDEAAGPAGAEGEDSLPGAEEFGMTREELVQNIEAVEAQIAGCMAEAGFEYVPVDYLTIRKGMTSDKTAPGLSHEEYAAAFGYGISTQLDIAGLPPQLATGTIVQTGLGEQNVQIFKNLPEADQEAYNHTLFGENTQATFAYTLEAEDFSETGGCTRAAIERVFSPEELNVSYYNPGDALIQQDPRMIAAITDWAGCMREAGFEYNNPEEIESDFEDRLETILDGAGPEELPAEAQAALAELQGEERAVAVADLACEEEFITPVEEQVQTELYGSPQQ
jgi:hypothetical protein